MSNVELLKTNLQRSESSFIIENDKLGGYFRENVVLNEKAIFRATFPWTWMQLRIATPASCSSVWLPMSLLKQNDMALSRLETFLKLSRNSQRKMRVGKISIAIFP